MGTALRQRLLRRLAAASDGGELALDLLAFGARPGRCFLGGLELSLVAAEVVAGELPAGFEGLALDPGVQLGGLRLALQRSQTRARLAFDVERPVEVVLGVAELQLGPSAALAVLAKPGGFLDQHATVAGLRGHDRLDPPLGDHRVHLLA